VEVSTLSFRRTVQYVRCGTDGPVNDGYTLAGGKLNFSTTGPYVDLRRFSTALSCTYNQPFAHCCPSLQCITLSLSYPVECTGSLIP
jgi:hypothetical protein